MFADVFSAGLLVVKMHTGESLLKFCDSEAEQIEEVVRVFGQPTDEQLSDMAVGAEARLAFLKHASDGSVEVCALFRACIYI